MILPLTLLADGETLLDLVPRVALELLEAERHALLLLVDVEHLDGDFLARLEHLARVVEAAPRHVRDVQQAVDAGQVDERAEIGQVLDRAGDDVADVDALQERLALGVALGLDEFAAREDDVLAVVVDLDDLEIVGVADELVEVLRRGDVDLAAGQERLDADVDHEAALDDALDLALDEAVAVEHADDLLPVLAVERLFAREDDHALVVFEAFEEHVDLVADVDVVEVVELGEGDDALGFVADVHEGFARAEFEDVAFDDGAFAEVAHRLRNEFLHSCHKSDFRVGQTTRKRRRSERTGERVRAGSGLLVGLVSARRGRDGGSAKEVEA